MNLSTPDQILVFLTKLGERLTAPADLYVFGGSALLLVGGRRATIDFDYTVESDAIEACRAVIAEVAAELGVDAEESLPSGFMPLAPGYESRRQLVGRFGRLTAYVLDPYSIAAMKIDRSFPSDIEDVQFLVDTGKINVALLGTYIEDIARRYDEPLNLKGNFAEFSRLLRR